MNIIANLLRALLILPSPGESWVIKTARPIVLFLLTMDVIMSLSNHPRILIVLLGAMTVLVWLGPIFLWAHRSGRNLPPDSTLATISVGSFLNLLLFPFKLIFNSDFFRFSFKTTWEFFLSPRLGLVVGIMAIAVIYITVIRLGMGLLLAPALIISVSAFTLFWIFGSANKRSQIFGSFVGSLIFGAVGFVAPDLFLNITEKTTGGGPYREWGMAGLALVLAATLSIIGSLAGLFIGWKFATANRGKEPEDGRS